MRNHISRALAVASLLALAPFPGPAVDKIPLGIAECEVVWSSKTSRPPQDNVAGIIVRLFSKNGKREVFAFSDKLGLAFVPLRPGEYCVEALDDEGATLELDRDQYNCFKIEQNERLTVGVVLKWTGGTSFR